MSNINYDAIDVTFPVAGVDNSSQGFRDNFTYIREGLLAANTAITTLENRSVLKASLATNSSGNTSSVVNDIGQSTISNGKFKQFNSIVHTDVVLSGVTNSNEINLNVAPTYELSLTYSASLRFTNWGVAGTYSHATIILDNSQQSGVWDVGFETTTPGNIHYSKKLLEYFPTQSLTANKVSLGGKSVSQINVTSPGSSYTVPATFTFTTANTITNYRIPTATATYKVVNFIIENGGSGYDVDDIFYDITNPQTKLKVTSIGNSGMITALDLISSGIYDTPTSFTNPTRNLFSNSANGSGAIIQLYFGIDKITVTDPGQGFTEAPTVEIISANSTPAEATVVLGEIINKKVLQAWSTDGGDNVYIDLIGEF